MCTAAVCEAVVNRIELCRQHVFELYSNLSIYSLCYAEACNEFAGPVSTVRAPWQQSLSFLKKYQSGGEPLAMLCPIWMARDLNLKPPAPVANALQEIYNHHGASSTTIVNTVHSTKFWSQNRIFQYIKAYEQDIYTNDVIQRKTDRSVIIWIYSMARY